MLKCMINEYLFFHLPDGLVCHKLLFCWPASNCVQDVASQYTTSSPVNHPSIAAKNEREVCTALAQAAAKTYLISAKSITGTVRVPSMSVPANVIGQVGLHIHAGRSHVAQLLSPTKYEPFDDFFPFCLE